MISVALCTYNGARFIQEQIDSILNQTSSVDEIVICDDGSTDETIHILEGYKKTGGTNIIIHQNTEREGAIKNFAQAINVCRGDIVFLSDQDDIWVPDKVKKICEFFLNHNSIDVVFSNASFIDEKGNSLWPDKRLWDFYFDKTSQKRCEWGLTTEEFCSASHATGATMAFKRHLIRKLSPREDIWHDEQIVLAAVAEHSLGYIGEDLIHYRVHSHQQIGVRGAMYESQTEKGNPLQPKLCYPKFVSLLTDKKDIKRTQFYNFRCGIKHHVLGPLKSLLHIGTYIALYKKRFWQFICYDIYVSVVHSITRLQRLLHK